MFYKNSHKNYYQVNQLITKAMLKRRMLSSAAIAKISDSKKLIRVVK
ncbi:hypothetical protein IJ670_02350 [bacterium]|nr:hypothetical protein [bacterium]